jgi:hypothetical protein
MRRVSALICVIILILFSIFQFGGLRSETGTVTTFSDKTSEKDLTIPSGGGTNYSASIEIPKKATITNAYFDVSALYSPKGEYPTKPAIDVGDDGDSEWAFSGVGYGDLGRQNVFGDDKPVQPIMFEGSETYKNDILIRLPKNATISSASMMARGAGAGNVLVIYDGAESYGLAKIKAALENQGNTVTMSKDTNLPAGWSDPKNFKAIFWIGGDSSAHGVTSTLLNPLINYVKTGGNFFACGSWIDYTGIYSGTYEIPFFEWALHHTWGTRWNGGGSGIGTSNKYTHQSNTTHPVFTTPNKLPSYWNNLYTGTFWHSPSGTINNGSIIGKVDTTTINPRYSAIIAWDGPEYDSNYGRTVMVRQPIARSWYNITQGDVLTNWTENVISWFLGVGKAANVTINIGDNGGTPEFEHMGELNESLKVPDFSGELTSLLSTLPVSFTDGYGIEFVDIPVNVTNDDEGMVLLSELDIHYNLTVRAFLNPHNSNLINELNELVPDTGDGNITIPLAVSAGSAGKVNIHNIIIDYFLPDLTNDRLLVINAHTPDRITYVDYENYLFMLNITNRAGVDDVNNITLILDALGEQPKVHWDQSTSTFTELYDPKDLIELDQLNCQNNILDSARWNLIFSIRFTWEYQVEAPAVCAVNTTNDTGASVFNYFYDVYRVENDLDLIGNLDVVSADQGKLIDDGVNNWVHASELITWSNLTVVYEGTTNIYPDDKNFNVTITDDDIGTWVNVSSSSKPFSITTVSDPISDYNDIHQVTITDIPGQGQDVSNWFFKIRTDNDGPLAPPNIICHADSPLDSETEVDDDNEIYVVWNFASDSSGSGVKEYAMEFNDPTPTQISSSGDSTTGTEGVAKFYVRARDRVGNWGSAGSATIIIDLTELTFSQPIPAPEVWQTDITVETGVLIQDIGGSGVSAEDIQYRYVDKGVIDNGAWHSYHGGTDGPMVRCKVNITFATEGTGKKVQWRAMDRAGNGYIYSEVYTLKIDSRPITIEGFSIDFNEWHNTLSPQIDFFINDTNVFGGECSGVDKDSIMYSISTSGTNQYGSWQILAGLGNDYSLSCSITPTLVEGVKNYLKFWAKDLAGNEYITGDLQVLIDVSHPEFSAPFPGSMVWNNETKIQCNITISDALSKVDINAIHYSISTNDVDNYGSWVKLNLNYLDYLSYYELTVTRDIVFLEGEDNYIKWSAADTAGNIYESEDYRILVDVTGCEIYGPAPEPWSWINATTVECSIIINDSEGSGINRETIEYTISLHGPNNNESWRNRGLEIIELIPSSAAKDSQGPTLILAKVVIHNFEEGDDNYIYWRATDLAQNKLTIGGPYRINIDIAPLNFYNPKPILGSFWSDIEHQCQITINDTGGSGVDPKSLEYRYMTASTDEFSSWSKSKISYAKKVDSYQFFVYLEFAPGLDNFIQWRGVDNAGNGPTESGIHRIMINSPPIPIITKPNNELEYFEKENLTFDGRTSFDPDQEDCLSFYWESNISSYLGSAAFFRNTLPLGNHKISLFVADNNNHNVSTHVNITVKKLDLDGDGIPNINDPDIDGDGYTNLDDLFPWDRSEWFDSDFDGIGNNKDKDDDNDGVADVEDDYPLDGSRWKKKEEQTESSDYLFWVIIIIILVLVIIITLIILRRRRKKRDEVDGELTNEVVDYTQPQSPTQGITTAPNFSSRGIYSSAPGTTMSYQLTVPAHIQHPNAPLLPPYTLPQQYTPGNVHSPHATPVSQVTVTQPIRRQPPVTPK